MNKKKIKMFKMKTIMILMSIMKLSQLIKNHQINNIPYIISGLITNKDLLILIFYVHMKFLVRQTKSTYVVMDLILNTHSLYKFKVPKIPILQNYTIPSQKNDPKNYA
jgi:hypothetical protein